MLPLFPHLFFLLIEDVFLVIAVNWTHFFLSMYILKMIVIILYNFAL